MTSKDFIEAENGNTGKIILYREGLFWKAYERSAYALCTQVRSFKPVKRSLKILDGGELVSIGFLISTEESVLKGLNRIESMPNSLVLASPSPIIESDFISWKASIELVSHLNNSNTADIKQSSAMILVERVSSFDLASSTPMDCMFFITELKKLLTS